MYELALGESWLGFYSVALSVAVFRLGFSLTGVRYSVRQAPYFSALGGQL